MRRVFFFLHKSILRRIFLCESGCFLQRDVDLSGLFFWDCSSFFLPFWRGMSIYLYNGRVFRRVYVFRAMVGQRLRFFSLTKLIGSSIHLRKKRGKKRRV